MHALAAVFARTRGRFASCKIGAVRGKPRTHKPHAPDLLHASLALLCRGTASHSGVAVFTDDEQASFCIVVNWMAGKLQWVKAKRAALDCIPSVGFDQVFHDVTQIQGRGEGPLGVVGSATSVELRVLVDGSAVEVFTGSGQVVSVRVYASSGAQEPRRLAAVVSGGSSFVPSVCAWRMQSMWL
jgi:hypothetical protein